MGVTANDNAPAICLGIQELTGKEIAYYNNLSKRGKYTNYSVIYSREAQASGTINETKTEQLHARIEALDYNSFMGLVTMTAYMPIALAYTAVSNPPPPPPPPGG